MSEYARFFNKASRYWQDEKDMNILFIKTQEQWLNTKLQGHGHVFLNEVYEALGLDKSCAGQLVGWVKESSAEKHIDIAIDIAIDYIDLGSGNPTIRLDFNVDGVILDRVNWTNE